MLIAQTSPTKTSTNDPGGNNNAPGEWKVWVKTSPCSGRNDWITVAKENPIAGGNFFYLATQIFPGTSCTTFGCTFQEATAVANTLRSSNEFFKYCCRDYSVWENIQTGKISVVQVKFGTAGFGWKLVKTDLCNEEAQALAQGEQSGDWKVWVKTSPCSGRYDWITVARENPTGGENFFYLANQIFQGIGCTTMGCTFSEANAIASSLRSSPQFSNYCCSDYSVWQNTQTGKMSVVKGKFGTAGFGWQIVKTDLCCEDAEALAGIPGACSGTDQAKINNTKCWPGSYAVINPQTQKVECYCNPGLVWNSTRTACIDPKELEKNTDCSVYPGSYAAWNAQSQRVECYCPTGKKWNDTRSACIDDILQVNCWPGSHAALNSQTNITECYCDPGLVWNSTKTACIDPQELVKNTDCSKYPGSYATWNTQTQRVECWCPTGKTWNSTMTACIDVTDNNNGNNQGNNNSGTKACTADDAAAFAKLTGSWKGYRMHVTIGGSCNQVTGTWKVTEWCEGVDETYNTTTARINGTFTGKMEGGSLQLDYQAPPSPNNSKGTKGSGSCYIGSNGTLSCSFGCRDELKK